MSTDSTNPTNPTDAEVAAALALLAGRGLTATDLRAAGVLATVTRDGRDYIPWGIGAAEALADAFRNRRVNVAKATKAGPRFDDVARGAHGVVVRGRDDDGNPTVNVNPRDLESAECNARRFGGAARLAAWVGEATDGNDALARIAAVGKGHHLAYSDTRTA